MKVLAGLSSLVYLYPRLGTSYEDVYPVSVHGQNHNILSDVRGRRRVFALVGGADGMSQLFQVLTDAGFGNAKVSVGQRLSYPDEVIPMKLYR